MSLKSFLQSYKTRRQRNLTPVEELPLVVCENCGFEFKGHFCPNCGQEVAEFNRPLGFVVYDFVGNFFAFDTRFFRSFKYLLLKPGFLTIEFFRGKRMRYSPPFRIFVFLSFILFLLLQILTERSLDKNISLNDNDKKKVVADLNLNGDTIKLADRDSAEIVAAMVDDTVALEKSKESNWKSKDRHGKNLVKGVVKGGLLGSGNMRERLTQMADEYEVELKTTTDPSERHKLQSYIEMCRFPNAAISTFLKYMSWTFFVLLPIFALLLKIFYIRKRQYYIKHFIFSVHIHSFLFFLLIVVISLQLIFRSGTGTISGLLMAYFPIYVVVALRKFYEQSYVRSLVKSLLIGFTYNIIVFSAVLYVFVKMLAIS